MKAKHIVIALTGLGTALAVAAIGWAYSDMEREIAGLHQRVASAAARENTPAAAQWQNLPPPVKRYLDFTFPTGPTGHTLVDMRMQGEFRRPRSRDFSPMTAHQSAASAIPALAFDATTAMMAGTWARAYDVFVDGRMEMKARVLSALTVVDEHSSPVLDRISLRRWLMESPMYPQALLPGGIVTWEAVDEHSARAVARYRDIEARLIARFGENGELLSFEAEEDGDLYTPYHGSGEYSARRDYRLVDGVRIPMSFTFSRRGGGKTYPFWEGRITRIEFAPIVAQRLAGDR